MGHSALYSVVQIVLIPEAFHDVLAVARSVMRDMIRHKEANEGTHFLFHTVICSHKDDSRAKTAF